MNKKGMEFWILVLLILAVVGTVFLFSGTKLWAGQAKENLPKEICRASVTMVALSKTMTGSPWLNLKCSTKVEKLKVENEEKNLKTLAQAIDDCWYQYEGGKIDFTSNWDWANYNNYCFVCFISNFDKEGESITKDKLIPYLPKSLGGGDFSGDLKVNQNNPIYIIFGIKKQIEGEKSMWGLVRFIFTLGSYKSEHVPSLIVSNRDTIWRQCDSLFIDSKEVKKR